MSKWIAEFELEDGDTMPEHMDLEYKGVRIDFHCKPLEQEPCEDAVSRKAVINQIFYSTDNNGDVVLGSALRERIARLPSVTPKIEPRKGHWIEEFVHTEREVRFTCSCCGKYQLFGTDFCYNCGAKMEVENGNDD